MKRLFALSLALVMALSLTACGGSKTPAAGSANTSVASSAPTSAKPVDSAPVLTRGDQVSEDIKADDGTVAVIISYTPISISYPANAEVEKAVQKDLDKGEFRDAGYFYGPTQPRTYFVGIKIMN